MATFDDRLISHSAGKDYDVIIVGAGPAGLSFARSLATTGLHIAVIERLPEEVLANPPVDGREIALTHLSVEILKKLDTWPRIPADAVSKITEARVMNGTSPYFLRFEPGGNRQQGLGYIVPNHLLRKAIYETLDGFANVDLITGVEARSVSTGHHTASVHLSDGRTLESALLVAADSRFSKTRRDLGISADMRDFGRTAIVCRMAHDKPHSDIAYECFHYVQTLAVLPLVGNLSSIVITLSTDRADIVQDMDEDAFNSDVERRFGSRLGRMKLVGSRYAYPLVAVHADKFVARRFALIGDAAVGMHPVTAHGFNLGLRGQDTLATEIATALTRHRDIASPSVLQRYHAKHKRATRPMYLATNGIVQLYTRDDLPARIIRGAMLRLGNRIRPINHAIMEQLTASRALPD